jgi:protein involved in polysaccharide export with SLBB domain
MNATLGGDAERLLSQSASGTGAVSQTQSGFATDNPIHPDFYYVGAGDVMTLEIVGPVSLTVPIVVSPESTILLPRFGEIIGAGKTLTQVRAEIQRLVQSRNPNNRAFLTLQRARTVYVRITGNVAQPGLYTLPASLRVSTAVQIANQEIVPVGGASAQKNPVGERKNTSFLSEAAPSGQYTIPFAQRNIKILHREGRAEVGDAVRSRLTGDAAADPCLREGDEIYVPFEHEAGETVSISGEVQRPCLVPFRKGDKISLLLKASYGLTDNADSNGIQIMEAVSAGSSSDAARILAVKDILSGAQDIPLRGGMSVIVKASTSQNPANTRRGMVSVLGEVQNPGVFAIESGVTRLKSIVQQTGGLTKNAYLPLSEVLRREQKSLTLSGAGMPTSPENMRNAQFSTLTPEDTLNFRMQEMMRRPTVSCDMQALMEKGSEADNITLQDGDVIMIAAKPRNVYVFGHVQKPGFVEFTQERDASAYIQAAGGFAPSADTARMRIIKAKNRLWLEPRISTGAQKGTLTALEAGDQIYVPRVPDNNTDLALKRVSAEIQREGLEVQKKQLELQQSTQVWQIITGIVGVLTGASQVFVFGRQLGVW